MYIITFNYPTGWLILLFPSCLDTGSLILSSMCKCKLWLPTDYQCIIFMDIISQYLTSNIKFFSNFYSSEYQFVQQNTL